MRLLLHFFTFYLISVISIAQNLKSPSEFLGYEIGTEFSRHNQVVDYFEYVTEKMNENVRRADRINISKLILSNF